MTKDPYGPYSATIDRKPLAKLLRTMNAYSKKHGVGHMPTTARLRTEENLLSIAFADPHRSYMLEVELDAEVAEKGVEEIFLDLSRLRAAVDKMKGDKLVLQTLEDSTLRIYGDPFHETLPALEEPTEPDSLPCHPSYETFGARRESLLETLKPHLEIVSSAVKAQEARTAFHNVHLDVLGDAFAVVSTDGRRMVVSPQEMTFYNSSDKTVPLQMNVPLKSLELVVKVWEGEYLSFFPNAPRPRASWQTSNSQIRPGVMIAWDGGKLWTECYEAAFARWDQVIPPDENIRATFPVQRQELLDALDTMHPWADFEQRRRLLFQFQGGGQLLLSDRAEKKIIAIRHWTEGEAFATYLDIDYLIAHLKTVSDEMVTFRVQDGEQKSVRIDSSSHVYVQMPCKLPPATQDEEAA